LDQLEEKGSYDNAWFPPQGIFDWTAVDKLEIVAEQMALTGINFWFDDIRDSGDSINYVPPVTGLSDDASEPGIALFPNPMGDRLNIEFELTKPGPVAISVYTVLGQKVGTISYENLTEGTHRVVWQDGHEAGAGFYIVEVRTPDKTRIMKVAKR
jgi:endoglucanase